MKSQCTSHKKGHTVSSFVLLVLSFLIFSCVCFWIAMYSTKNISPLVILVTEKYCSIVLPEELSLLVSDSSLEILEWNRQWEVSEVSVSVLPSWLAGSPSYIFTAVHNIILQNTLELPFFLKVRIPSTSLAVQKQKRKSESDISLQLLVLCCSLVLQFSTALETCSF